MTNTFTNTDSTQHSTLITNLEDGQTYIYYVRCNDIEGNYNTDDFNITFSINSTEQICTDFDNDNYYLETGCGTLIDCNDTNASIYPSAVEICGNNIDEDCNGEDLQCLCNNADKDKNNIVELDELMSYIDVWKNNLVTIGQLMEVIGQWKDGCS